MEVGRVEVKKKRARYSEENVEIRAWILQQQDATRNMMSRFRMNFKMSLRNPFCYF